MACSRPQGIRPGLFYGLFTLLFATNVLTGVALMTSPDVTALIRGRQAKVVAGYEDRIAELRLEVDRLHSRQYAQAGDINLQLQELAQQQETLTEQHQYVKALLNRANTLGITPKMPADDHAEKSETGLSPTALSFPPTGSTNGVALADETEIERTGHQIRTMMDESREALMALTEGAEDATDDIVAELHGIGLKPDLPTSIDDDEAGVGGPLLPPLADTDSRIDDTSIIDKANDVMVAFARFNAAREAISSAPVIRPVPGSRVSSRFGNRRDPFTGRLALHPGIDLPDPRGTTVRSAGAGKVVRASWMSGYGNLVEIDHGNGYITRYGHLSSYLVHVGEEVEAGDPIGRVGSTGRSTGPHVHFEVRRGDRPIDPAPFLAAGQRLERFRTLG